MVDMPSSGISETQLDESESHHAMVRPSVPMPEGLRNALQKNPGRKCEFNSRW